MGYLVMERTGGNGSSGVMVSMGMMDGSGAMEFAKPVVSRRRALDLGLALSARMIRPAVAMPD